MNSWIHVCITADTSSGNLSALVNDGQPVFLSILGLSNNKPENLQEKLYIGQATKAQEVIQYQGEVANLNILSGSINVGNLSNNLCDLQGDII